MVEKRGELLPSAQTIVRRLATLVLTGAYLPSEYQVFDDRRLVYIPIGKVASTSIKLALLGRMERVDYPACLTVHREGTYAVGRRTLTRKQQGYFKFAFVRYPFDRLVSCYEDRVRRHIHEDIGRYYFDTDYNHILIRTLCNATFDTSMSFESFVRLVCRVPDRLADGHFRSQVGIVQTWQGRLIPDYIGHFESIGDDWGPIAAKFNLPTIDQHNGSERRDITSYFTSPEIVEAAAHRFRHDIREFGYVDSYQRLRRRLSY